MDRLDWLTIKLRDPTASASSALDYRLAQLLTSVLGIRTQALRLLQQLLCQLNRLLSPFVFFKLHNHLAQPLHF